MDAQRELIKKDKDIEAAEDEEDIQSTARRRTIVHERVLLVATTLVMLAEGALIVFLL